MKLVNTRKVKKLLEQNGIKQIALAEHLGLPASGLSDSLNGKRPLSMNHVFDLADFFKVDAKSLTIDNNTKNHDDKSTTKNTKEVA